MTTLYLIRHAQAEGNIRKHFQGRIDLPLTADGEKQVKMLADRMRPVALDAIYASPLIRAWKTAEAIAEVKGMSVIRCDGVVEIDGGAWEDISFTEIEKKYPEEYRQFVYQADQFQGVGGGESYQAVCDRMRDAIVPLVEKHRGGSIAVVSHGAAIRGFICYAMHTTLDKLGDTPWGANTSVSQIEFDDDLSPTIVQLFDVSHLNGGSPEWLISYTEAKRNETTGH